jgi:hypothetical protein
MNRCHTLMSCEECVGVGGAEAGTQNCQGRAPTRL